MNINSTVMVQNSFDTNRCDHVQRRVTFPDTDVAFHMLKYFVTYIFIQVDVLADVRDKVRGSEHNDLPKTREREEDK